MKRFELLFLMLQVPVDYLMLVFAAAVAYSIRFTHFAITRKPVLFDLTASDFISQAAVAAFVWLAIFALAGLYAPNPNRRFAKDIPKILMASTAGIAVIAVYILFTQQLFESRFLIAVSWVLAIAFVIIGRLLVRALRGICYRAGIGLRRIVIIGSDAIADELEKVLNIRKELGFQVIKRYSVFTDVAVREIESSSIDEMLFTNPRGHEDKALEALAFAQDNHITFKYSADLFATLTANTTVHPLAGVPIVELKRTRLEGWGRIVKRTFDIVMSILLIGVTSPIMLLAAVAILIETGKPIIYRNTRVGVRRKQFFTLKFRSMYQKDSTGDEFGGKEADVKEQALIQKQNTKAGPIYKIANDPRVTKVGNFIRRWSIDELPQFFNVLKGEMSIVGPRPHQPREVAGYERRHRVVFDIKPGITGLAQISGRSDLTFEDEMRLDALYIEKWSLWLDLIIFLKTPFILFKKRKAL